MKKTLVVLAGGLGSRYKAIKQLDAIQKFGHTLMEYAMYDAIASGFSHIVLVINESHAAEMQHFIDSIKLPSQIKISLALQRISGYVSTNHLHLTKERIKPWGTAHAVLSAKEQVKSPFVVINADDYYGRNAYNLASLIMENNQVNENKYHMLGYPIKATLSKNGTVSRGICSILQAKLTNITERTTIQQIDNKLTYKEKGRLFPISERAIVSMNFWVFHPSIFSYLQNKFTSFLAKNPTQNEEFYLPFAVNQLIQNNTIDVGVSVSTDEWMGLTYAEDKKLVAKQIKMWTKKAIYPIKLWP